MEEDKDDYYYYRSQLSSYNSIYIGLVAVDTIAFIVACFLSIQAEAFIFTAMLIFNVYVFLKVQKKRKPLIEKMKTLKP